MVRGKLAAELEQAIQENDVDSVRQAIKYHADVNSETFQFKAWRHNKVGNAQTWTNVYNTPLGMACHNGCFAVAQVLLTEGTADINLIPTQNYSPLWQAAAAGHADIVRMLLDHGADATIQDHFEDGFTPLQRALREPLYKMPASVVVALADYPNDNERTALHNILQGPDCIMRLDVVQQLVDIEKGNTRQSFLINSQDDDGRTALHYCSLCGDSSENEGVIQYLVKEGARLDIQDSNGQTPLHLTCLPACWGHYYCQEKPHLAILLASLGASLVIKDKIGKTPVDLANNKLAAALQYHSDSGDLKEMLVLSDGESNGRKGSGIQSFPIFRDIPVGWFSFYSNDTTRTLPQTGSSLGLVHAGGAVAVLLLVLASLSLRRHLRPQSSSSPTRSNIAPSTEIPITLYGALDVNETANQRNA